MEDVPDGEVEAVRVEGELEEVQALDFHLAEGSFELLKDLVAQLVRRGAAGFGRSLDLQVAEPRREDLVVVVAELPRTASLLLLRSTFGRLVAAAVSVVDGVEAAEHEGQRGRGSEVAGAPFSVLDPVFIGDPEEIVSL